MKPLARIATATVAVVFGSFRPQVAASQAMPRQTSAASNDVGILIGLSSQRTLWLSSTDSGFRLVADRPYLLVPRKDGFWWVGTETRCTAEELTGDGMNITATGAFVDSEEALFVTRAGDTANVILDGESCGTAEEKAHEINRKLARAMADSLAAAGDSSALQALKTDTVVTDEGSEGLYCGIGTRTITFVSPKLISVEHRDRVTEFCSPAKYYESGENRVTAFDDTTGIEVRSVLTKAQQQQLAKEMAGEDRSVDTESDETGGPGWAVRRDSGNWVASIFIDGSIASRGGADLEYRPALPRAFTGDARLPISWAKLKKLYPNLRDAAGSPSGNHIALLAGDSLIVAPVQAAKLGKPLIELSVGPYQDFVTLRWASGRQVAEWNRAIPAVPRPYIKVQSLSQQ